MKTFKLKNIFLGLGMLASVGCTDLSETTYDIVPQDGFYQTKENVLQAFVRPFGHGYWLCCRAMYWFGELSAHLLSRPVQGHQDRGRPAGDGLRGGVVERHAGVIAGVQPVGFHKWLND